MSASLSTHKRSLKRAHDGRYRDRIATARFAHARSRGDVPLVLYGVTTLYFEAEKEDELRKVGFSKQSRVDPQIVAGLLVDRTGFPLAIGRFQGNKAETHTLVPIMKSFQARHGIEAVVVVVDADAGMLSAKAPNALWRAVWAFSTKRFVRDHKTLSLQENRARAVLESDKAARATRFVKTSGSARSLDEAALARVRMAAGLKGYVTNIPAAIMPAGEVISSYRDLWHVEASFRMSKTDPRARPFFARTREAIGAHLTIVFTALAVSRTIQDRSGRSIRKVLRDLRPVRSATIEAGGVVTDVAPTIPADKQALLDALRTPSSGH